MNRAEILAVVVEACKAVGHSGGAFVLTYTPGAAPCQLWRCANCGFVTPFSRNGHACSDGVEGGLHKYAQIIVTRDDIEAMGPGWSWKVFAEEQDIGFPVYEGPEEQREGE